MIKAEILVPLLNANEPEARLVNIHVAEGQLVEKDALLFTLETTKAAADVAAPEAGHVRLLSAEGDLLAVGDRLAVITETADEPVELPVSWEGSRPTSPAGELRITKPARLLAESLGIDLSALPGDRLVTEDVVREITGRTTLPTAEIKIPSSRAPESQMLIYGGGGHAKAVMDLVLQLQGFEIVGIADDKLPPGSRVLGIPVLGDRRILPQLVEKGVQLAANGVGGIIDIRIRMEIFTLLEGYGFSFPALVHPNATVEPNAQVGDGVQVFANAYVGSESILQPRCMINTAAVVSHDCEIGAYSHIAPGVLLAGHVKVGERALVGMGVTTAIGISIGVGARIGNAAILLADVPPKTIVQAGKVWTG